MNASQIESIQRKYHYLTNYQSDDPTSPIDPLTYVDSNGDHLIHIAAVAGDVSTVGVLLDGGIDVNLEGDMSNTALHYAYHHDRSEVVSLLRLRGASDSLRNEFGKLPHEYAPEPRAIR